MTLEDRGPKVAETEIASLEASLGSPLPAEYREFLLSPEILSNVVDGNRVITRRRPWLHP
jgi:hypothetical protein